MNHLASLLPLDCVRIHVSATSRKRVFEEASLMFERSSGVSHTEAFDAMFAREKLGSTCLGHGCAIPHGRLASIHSLSLVFLRTQEGVLLDAPDHEPVSVFLCLLIPESDETEYLTVLRELKALLEDRVAREVLSHGVTDEAICQFIHDWEPPKDLHPLVTPPDHEASEHAAQDAVDEKLDVNLLEAGEPSVFDQPID